MRSSISNLFRLVAAIVASAFSHTDVLAGEAKVIPLSSLKSIDLDGVTHKIGQMAGSKGVALLFISPECPVSNQYVPELNRLAARAKEKSVEFYGIISDETITRAKGAEYPKQFNVKFPILFDATGELRNVFEPTHVPEVFVLDQAGQIIYRGRIDDQYTDKIKRKANVSTHELADAIDALHSGSKVSASFVPPVGCKLEKPKSGDGPVTYHRHIAPILYANCVECHRAGEVAPFELLSFDDAAKRASFLTEVVSAKKMPPWKVKEGHGEFIGERRLSPREIDLLDQWAKTGAKEGNPADQPPAPVFTDGWKLGEPDLVIKMPVEYKVPASGPDIFRFFVTDIPVPEDKMVVGVEFRPGNPRVVHHAIMYLDRSGQARKRDEATPEPGYEGFLTGGFRPDGVLGFWAPGYTARMHGEEAGQPMKKGSDLAFQLHYHPSGKEEVDQSMIGIHFADKPITKKISGLILINFDVNIPANEKRHRMEYSFVTPVDLKLIEIVPHMHMIGTEMKVTATLPDGKQLPLIWLDWDFNWQDVFRYRHPIQLPAGTKLDVEGYFDNSTDNPYNPSSPPKQVLFGEQTVDEMFICAFRTVEDIGDPRNSQLRLAVRKSMIEQMKKPAALANMTRFMANGGAGEGDGLFDRLNPRIPRKEEAGKP